MSRASSAREQAAVVPAEPVGQAAPAPDCILTVIVPTFNERANVARVVERLHAVLDGLAWRVIFVDDDSPDGTAEAVKQIAATDPRVQCIRRVRRRGLAGAVVEGVLASASPYVGVIDGDLQHDETLLPKMLEVLRSGQADLVIASRYIDATEVAEGLSPMRSLGSRFANWLGRLVLRQDVSDPVSGFFMARRELVDRVAPRLATEGFKILFDLIASQPEPLRIAELPYSFREREAGGSKLDNRVVVDYLGLLLSKLSGGIVPTRALLFGLVGGSGLVVQLVALKAFLTIETALTQAQHVQATNAQFTLAQFGASVVAMTSNYLINNEITYRDRRQRGLKLLLGYMKFCALCSIGLAANLAVSSMIFQYVPVWWLAGVSGALFAALWNYVSTAAAVW
ncbi:MAG: glycosyltransferase family 2 protein [Caulobacteraceae bacterium]|nr:glycosyltransferase family 2 protein [Caulobacteraceae bacterium]